MGIINLNYASTGSIIAIGGIIAVIFVYLMFIRGKKKMGIAIPSPEPSPYYTNDGMLIMPKFNPLDPKYFYGSLARARNATSSINSYNPLNGVMSYAIDTDLVAVRSRIIDIMSRNMLDTNVFNANMDKIMDMLMSMSQQGGELYNLIDERRKGIIDRADFTDRIHSLILELSSKLNLPLRHKIMTRTVPKHIKMKAKALKDNIASGQHNWRMLKDFDYANSMRDYVSHVPSHSMGLGNAFGRQRKILTT